MAGQFYHSDITTDDIDVDAKVPVITPQPKIPAVHGLGF